jgi:hypothetical protein
LRRADARIPAVIGMVRLAAIVALCWTLTVKLTPPNKPVENGLEVFVPGVIILLLGLPSALTSVVLMWQGIEGTESAVRVDGFTIALILLASLLFLTPSIMLVALVFAADAGL